MHEGFLFWPMIEETLEGNGINASRKEKGNEWTDGWRRRATKGGAGWVEKCVCRRHGGGRMAAGREGTGRVESRCGRAAKLQSLECIVAQRFDTLPFTSRRLRRKISPPLFGVSNHLAHTYAPILCIRNAYKNVLILPDKWSSRCFPSDPYEYFSPANFSNFLNAWRTPIYIYLCTDFVGSVLFITYSSLDSMKMIPLSVEYQIETVGWICEKRRTLYFRYYVSKLNRCCLHVAVFCRRNQRNPHRFAKSANRR